MYIKQLSIFLPNSTGSLLKILKLLEEQNVLIRSFTIADDGDFGILRLLLDEKDFEKGYAILDKNNYILKKNEIIVFKLPYDNANFSSIFEKINQANIDLEYFHCAYNEEINKSVFMLKSDNMDELKKIIKEYE